MLFCDAQCLLYRPKKTAKAKGVEEVDESDSSDEERELDMETLDPQSLVKDDEDQKYLDSLPEFEREAILGERFEKLKNEADMKKALRESRRKEREERKAADKTGKKATKSRTKAKAKESSKKADTAGDAELAAKLSSRESTRNRDATGKKGNVAAALAALRVSADTMKENLFNLVLTVCN